MPGWKGIYPLHEFTAIRVSCPGCGREELLRIKDSSKDLERRCATPDCRKRFKGNRRIYRLRRLLRSIRAGRKVRLETE